MSILGVESILFIRNLTYTLHMIGLNLFQTHSTLHPLITHTTMHPKLRKDKPSTFQDFEIIRKHQAQKQQQYYKNEDEGTPKARKKRSSSMVSVIVRSQQQKELMTFLGSNKLPKVEVIMKSHRKKTHKNRKSKHNSVSHQDAIYRSPLETILSNKPKFMRTYFQSLSKIESTPIDHVLPEISLRGWQVKGFIKGGSLLLKLVNKNGKQKFYKYVWSVVKTKIQNIGYEQFIKEKMQLQGLW